MAALDQMSLYPFQKEGIAFATNREASLIADDMGLGKTVQEIGVINEDASIRRVLVVCPASVRIPWQRELDQWLNRSFTIAVVGVNCQKPLSGDGITIINYDRLARFENELGAYDLAVLDECQYIKTPSSRRTLAAFKIRARRRIGLSGTQLWSLLTLLDPSAWPDFMSLLIAIVTLLRLPGAGILAVRAISLSCAKDCTIAASGCAGESGRS
jgi:superfamily II DNA or RNA helicase